MHITEISQHWFCGKKGFVAMDACHHDYSLTIPKMFYEPGLIVQVQ